jgi:hypothetical protein
MNLLRMPKTKNVLVAAKMGLKKSFREEVFAIELNILQEHHRQLYLGKLLSWVSSKLATVVDRPFNMSTLPYWGMMSATSFRNRLYHPVLATLFQIYTLE